MLHGDVTINEIMGYMFNAGDLQTLRRLMKKPVIERLSIWSI